MKSLRTIRTVCAVASLLVAFGLADARGQSPADTVVVYSRGYAEVKFKTATGFERLVKGAHLGTGDVIETGDSGKVQLQLSDGSTVVIGANSRVVIKELETVEVTRTSISTFELLSGKIRAIVVPFISEDSRFRIETGNATVGVRGTDFGVIRDPIADTTHLLTLEGTVYISPIHFPHVPPIELVGGEEITVTGSLPPPKPSKAPGLTTYQFLQKMMLCPSEEERGGGGGDKIDQGGPSKTW